MSDDRAERIAAAHGALEALTPEERHALFSRWPSAEFRSRLLFRAALLSERFDALHAELTSTYAANVKLAA
jgi:hypothetical protein